MSSIRVRRVAAMICSLVVAITVFGGFPLCVAEDSAAVLPDGTAAAKPTSEIISYTDYAAIQQSTPCATQPVTVSAVQPSATSGAETAVATDEDTGRACLDWTNEAGTVTWSFSVPADGRYCLYFTYKPLPGHENPVNLGVFFDGVNPYTELSNIFLPRYWQDAGSVREDGSGNQLAPEQQESFRWSTVPARDTDGLHNRPLEVYLSAGQHTMTLESLAEPFRLESVSLIPPENMTSYAEQLADWKQQGVTVYSGDNLMVEGESAVLKTSKSLVPKVDNSDVTVTPSSPSLDMLNYIGASNWKNMNDTLEWTVTVRQTGLYAFGFHFRQSYVLDGQSYRRLEIDGALPFAEAENISFGYEQKWAYMTFADGQGEPYLFYLTAGEHTLSLAVTMGPTAEINEELAAVVRDIGTINRKITMITGETPDANRDYDLFGQISGLEQSLTEDRDALRRLAEKLLALTGKNSSSNVAVMRNMANVIDRMLAHPFQASDYKSDFFSNYCSIGTVLYEMRKLPLDLDSIVMGSPEQVRSYTEKNWFDRVAFSMQRFVNSFFRDYNQMSAKEGGEEQDSITLWLYWGRDQTQVLTNLISDSFTPEYNIHVNVRIVNASLIQAILSGSGPDLSLRLSRADPVNMAMRGALYDLTQFSDYEEVANRFMPTASVPYQYNGGCYALPDTQQFYMMFYRKDILQELGLQVPRTWEEFLACVSVLSSNNLQAGIPYTQISNMSQTNLGVGALNLYSSILMQYGGQVYSDDLTRSALSETTALQAFSFWTDLYTQYKLPTTYDFYNRFRSGEMPLGIATYTQYATLSVAAQEIRGLWGMAPIPGVQKADGTINNTDTGGGSGSVILKQSASPELAWTFLKWWTSADAQVKYSSEIESVLGTVERQATANVEALQRLSWTKEDLQVLNNQWKVVQEVPEVPGGYFTPRVVDQAFWAVINNGANPRDTLTKWSHEADTEIARKRKEYGLDNDGR